MAKVVEQAKCPNCGAYLPEEHGVEGNCSYCGTRILYEESTLDKPKMQKSPAGTVPPPSFDVIELLDQILMGVLEGLALFSLIYLFVEYLLVPWIGY